VSLTYLIVVEDSHTFFELLGSLERHGLSIEFLDEVCDDIAQLIDSIITTKRGLFSLQERKMIDRKAIDLTSISLELLVERLDCE